MTFPHIFPNFAHDIYYMRNPLLADFCAKTILYRGLGSGIRRALKENVKIDFECVGGQFKAVVWRTEKAADGLAVNDSGVVINDQKLVVNEEDLTVKLVVNGKKLTVKVGNNDEKLVVKLKKLTVRAEKLTVNLTVNRIEILRMILENPTITTIEMAQAIGISCTAVKNNLEVMRDKLIRRVGSDKSGFWEVILE